MDYRQSILLKNGDLVFDSLGKLKLISREEKLIQSIKLKIGTRKNELFYNEEYGLDIYRIRKLDREVLESLLKDAIVDNEVIIDLRLINFNIDEDNLGVVSAEMEIFLFEGDTLTVTFDNEDVEVL